MSFSRILFTLPRHGAALCLLGLPAVTLLPAALTTTAHAQEFRGTISGAVTDASGAAIPNAAILIRETNTGTTNKTVSDGAGQYVVPFLLPGTYSITATAAGFETTNQAGITLQSQEHPILNLTLTVGSESQTITVTSAAPLVDQANASVGQVISTESVADLPLNGRTPTTLTELSVGVITTAAPQIVHPFDNSAGNSWSIGGTPNQVSEVLLDGSPDLTLLGQLAYAPTQDSVREVSVRPFDTDASFGHTIGGVINQITKSGTNAYHGTAYEFYQTAGLDANLYFNKRATPQASRPNAHYHQYGGTIGGPLTIPKLYNGHDKLFFFFAAEGIRDSTPATTTLTVPTAAERTGDFSQTLAGGCPTGFNNNPAIAAAICNANPANNQASPYADPNQLYNPFTASLNAKGQVVRQPILNNQLNSAGPLNPVAAAYLKLFPQPNTTGTATGQNNYISGAPSIDTYSNEFGRMDINISSRDHLFFDGRHNHRTQVKNDFFGNGSTGTTLLRNNYGATMDNVFTISPTTILDTRVNWTFFDENHGTPAQAYSSASVGLPASYSAGTESQLPCVLFAGTSTTGSAGTCGTSSTTYQTLGDNTSALDPTTSYQLFTDVVKTVGRHTLKVGFDGRQYRLSVQNFGNSSGTLVFGSAFVTGGSATTTGISFGGDLADLYFGLPTAGQYDIASRADYHNYYTGTFVQDDYRFNDHLTLNFGLRFDIDTPFREKSGHTVSGFNPTAVNAASAAAAAAYTAKPNALVPVANFNTLGGLTFPGTSNGAVYNTNAGFFSPRFGFSYSPNGRSVLRGGFGIFVQPETLSSLAATGTYSSNAISNTPGFSGTTTLTSTTNNGLTPAVTLSNPFPNGFVQPSATGNGVNTNLGQSISFLAPNEHDPYSERYNLGIQHSLTNSTLLEVLYVGNHSLHLPVAVQNLNAVRLPYLSTAPFRNQTQASAYGALVPNPYAGLLPNGGNANSASVATSSLLVPYPEFGTNAVNIQNQTIGQSYFNSGIVHIEQRASHGLTLTANFSFAKLTEADTFLNDQDAAPTHRLSTFDHTYHFTTGATYNLPFGRGKAFDFGGNHFLDEVFGGFVINGIYQFQSGPPVEFSADIPLQPGANTRTLTNSTRNASPINSGTPALSVNQFVTGNNTVCPTDTNGKPISCDLSGQSFFNGQYSNHYRTLPQTISTVRGDGFNNLDASLLKNFNFTEKTFLQIRFESFNTLNHPVFATPNVSSATASNFGYITAVAPNSQPRQVQLGARLVF